MGYVLGVALLGLLDDSLGRGAASDTPRGWRGHARAVLSGGFSTGAIKAAGALALAAYAVSGRGREGLDYFGDLALLLLATNLFNLLDLRPGRVEKVFALLLAGLCLGAWTAHPLELLGLFIGPVLVGARSRCASGRCSATRARTSSGALAGVSILITLERDGPLDRPCGGRGADDLWGVSVDLRGDRADSAPAVARLARQSETR